MGVKYYIEERDGKFEVWSQVSGLLFGPRTHHNWVAEKDTREEAEDLIRFLKTLK